MSAPPGNNGDPASDPVRLTAWLRGRVQGVGMRWWVRSRALELGLVGTATNLDDGRVEVVAPVGVNESEKFPVAGSKKEILSSVMSVGGIGWINMPPVIMTRPSCRRLARWKNLVVVSAPTFWNGPLNRSKPGRPQPGSKRQSRMKQVRRRKSISDAKQKRGCV